MQTDPIGYEDGLNLYAYVGNDPINLNDPTGLMGDPLLNFFGGLFGVDGANQRVSSARRDLVNSSGEEPRNLVGPSANERLGFAQVDRAFRGTAAAASAAAVEISAIAATEGAGAGIVASSARASSTSRFLFRGDSRNPGLIFNEGFTARGNSTDLLAHAINNSQPPSNFVSTSTSSDIAGDFFSNIFIIRDPGTGIDVNRALGNASPFPNELEVAIPSRINPSDIRGVTDNVAGVTHINPNFVP